MEKELVRFLDRKRMVRQENFVLVEEIYKNEQEYEAKVTKVEKRVTLRCLWVSAFYLSVY